MFLEFSGVSGLLTSYTLLRPQLAPRCLASSCPDRWLQASRLLPDMPRALDRDSRGRALASVLHWQAARPPAGPLAVAGQTFVLGKLSFKL